MSAEPTTVAIAPQSGRELMKKTQPRLKVGRTALCLRPDLLDRWDELQAELGAILADQAAKGRLAGGKSASAKKKAGEIQALEAEIAESQIWFTSKAMDKPTYRLLKDRNPPRSGHQVDAFLGYNAEAVRDEQVRMCLIDPVFEDCEDDDCDHEDCGTWQAFELVCNPSEWEELQRLTEEVNGRVAQLPKSEAARRLLERPSTAPAQRAHGG